MSEIVTIPGLIKYQIEESSEGRSRLVATCHRTAETSDGYHTFDELYHHRCVLYLAFLKLHADRQSGWRSHQHSDGTTFDGWFIVGTEIAGQQVSYHLPSNLWDLSWFLTEYPQAPVKWDGHTSDDVLRRLTDWLKLET